MNFIQFWHVNKVIFIIIIIAQNVRFEIPYKVLYFETPFLMIFKYYAWASYVNICNVYTCELNKLLAISQMKQSFFL